MFVEVDQSVKIEFTGQDTVLAIASINQVVPIVRTVLVPAAAKRKGLLTLRARGWPDKRAAVGLFSAAVYLLARPYLARLESITVDIEYTGYEGVIGSRLINWARDLAGVDLHGAIEFEAVTKASPAHEAALRVTRGESPPTARLKLGQLLELLGTP